MAGWAAVGSAAAQFAMNEAGQQQARQDATTNLHNTMMLDQFLGENQMQWRVSDLKKAGLNPMLAAGGGLSGIATQTAPPIQTQNTGAGVVQAGLTGAQIAQSNAQTALLEAQAKKTRWETGDQGVPLDANGNPDWTRAGGGAMGNYTAQQAWQAIQNLKATYDNIVQQTASGKTGQELTDVQRQINSLNLQQQKVLFDTIVAKAKADLGLTAAQATDAEAVAKITGNPTWGPIIKLFRMVIPGGIR